MCRGVRALDMFPFNEMILQNLILGKNRIYDDGTKTTGYYLCLISVIVKDSYQVDEVSVPLYMK